MSLCSRRKNCFSGRRVSRIGENDLSRLLSVDPKRKTDGGRREEEQEGGQASPCPTNFAPGGSPGPGNIKLTRKSDGNEKQIPLGKDERNLTQLDSIQRNLM